MSVDFANKKAKKLSLIVTKEATGKKPVPQTRIQLRQILRTVDGCQFPPDRLLMPRRFRQSAMP